VVLDAVVALRLTKTGEADIRKEATHSLATNKLLYSASLSPPRSGVWRLEVELRGPAGNGSSARSIQVMETESAVGTYWPYFAVVPVFICLFIMNRYLKKSNSHGFRA
jgi:hypothetical protein